MVAPFMGAWIEIKGGEYAMSNLKSLPSWERGLKYIYKHNIVWFIIVAPFMGAWIEILLIDHIKIGILSRSLHGSVD